MNHSATVTPPIQQCPCLCSLCLGCRSSKLRIWPQSHRSWWTTPVFWTFWGHRCYVQNRRICLPKGTSIPNERSMQSSCYSKLLSSSMFLQDVWSTVNPPSAEINGLQANHPRRSRSRKLVNLRYRRASRCRIFFMHSQVITSSI